MGRNSLLHCNRANKGTRFVDTSLLGPSDSSDNGSDMAGRDGSEPRDPALPMDVAMRENRAQGLRGGESLPSDAADIGVDHVFVPKDGAAAAERALSDDEDPDPAFIDDVQAEDLLIDEESYTQDGEQGQDEQRDASERLATGRAVESDAVPPPALPQDPDDTDATGLQIPALLRRKP